MTVQADFPEIAGIAASWHNLRIKILGEGFSFQSPDLKKFDFGDKVSIEKLYGEGTKPRSRPAGKYAAENSPLELWLGAAVEFQELLASKRTDGLISLVHFDVSLNWVPWNDGDRTFDAHISGCRVIDRKMSNAADADGGAFMSFELDVMRVKVNGISLL